MARLRYRGIEHADESTEPSQREPDGAGISRGKEATMKSMTILGAITKTIPAYDYAELGLPGISGEARTALVWRVAVQGFGRDQAYPKLADRITVREYECAGTREDLRKLVEKASREDLAAYRAGD